MYFSSQILAEAFKQMFAYAYKNGPILMEDESTNIYRRKFTCARTHKTIYDLPISPNRSSYIRTITQKYINGFHMSLRRCACVRACVCINQTPACPLVCGIHPDTITV